MPANRQTGKQTREETAKTLFSDKQYCPGATSALPAGSVSIAHASTHGCADAFLYVGLKIICCSPSINPAGKSAPPSGGFMWKRQNQPGRWLDDPATPA